MIARLLRPRQPRRGYTLTELLVVIMILVILVATILPVAKTVMEDSRTREASRQLNGNFAMARTYAGRHGRPFGLWFEYDQPVGNAVPGLRQCTRVFLAEVQPPYGGDVLGSSLGGANSAADPSGPWPLTLTSASMLPTITNPGEFFAIRFDYKGHWFVGYRDNNAPANYYLYGRGGPDNEFGRAGIDDNSNSTVDDASEHMWTGSDDLNIPIPPSVTSGKPYQILRSPRRVGNPMELTGGTCIDVEYSGMGPTGTQFGVPNNRLVVMFGAGGGIDSIFADDTLISPTGTLHFLIGKVEKVNPPPVTPAPFDLELHNLADPNGIWVSVGRLSGATTSAENMPDVEHGISHPSPWSAAGYAEYLEECRVVATGREQMGGK